MEKDDFLELASAIQLGLPKEAVNIKALLGELSLALSDAAGSFLEKVQEAITNEQYADVQYYTQHISSIMQAEYESAEVLHVLKTGECLNPDNDDDDYDDDDYDYDDDDYDDDDDDDYDYDDDDDGYEDCDNNCGSCNGCDDDHDLDDGSDGESLI